MLIGEDTKYEQTNEIVRYTLHERIQHLGLFLTLSTGLGAAFYWQPNNVKLRILISFLGILVTLIIWIMQWRAVWRMQTLLHIIQEMENDDNGLWNKIVKSKRPLWLNKVGDTEATTFLFITGMLAWIYFFTSITIVEIINNQKDYVPVEWAISVISLTISIVMTIFLNDSLENPTRTSRTLPAKQQSVP